MALTPLTVTVTSTVPAACAGTGTMIVVAVTLVGVAEIAPNITLVFPVTKPAPVIVTLPPPVVLPLFGLRLATTGR